MTTSQATAEIFITALKALPKKDRESVLLRIVDEKDLRKDLLDLALISKRRKEPSRPFRQYLAEKRK